VSVTILADHLTRPQAVQLARRLWDNGNSGWTIREIRDYIAKRGHDVHGVTIHVWVDPEYGRQRAESLKASKKRLYHAKKNRQPSALTPELLLALRVEDGLAYTAIAAVARRFFGEDMTEDQVRHRLYGLGAPKNPNKSRAVRLQRQRQRVAA
jgi:hypothetical protein